ncbi:MAG: DNA-formamidopyrimidine glycosylase [Bacillota bacterium]
MPELPEVETVRQTLKHFIIGKTIKAVFVHHKKMITPKDETLFKTTLQGQTLQDIDRLGKYLLFKFNHDVLVVHLRMEGKFYLKDITSPKDKHDHITYVFDDDTTLVYNDVRKFGTHELKTYDDLYTTNPLMKLGFEPTDNRLTVPYLKNKLKTTRYIKPTLLDQTIILGLGNIYVDEVLFCAKIRPTKRAYKVTKKECAQLIACSQAVIEKAIALGGTTIRSYTDSLGVTGRFQNELMVHMQEHQLCKHCGTPIKKTKVAGRGTYFCPTCQKA